MKTISYKTEPSYIPGAVRTLLIIALLLVTAVSVSAEEENINLGSWTEPKLDRMMEQKAQKTDASEQIDFLSAEFLGTPYVHHTLIGDKNTPEVFTINLAGMDCFTYIDYVEALRVSENFPEFKDSLQNIRYEDGEVAFKNRNHFFTDWPVNNPSHVKDVTRDIGGVKAVSVTKNLNVKKDGSFYLPGIETKERVIYYLPAGAIDAETVGKLNTGDYVGIYTALQSTCRIHPCSSNP